MSCEIVKQKNREKIRAFEDEPDMEPEWDGAVHFYPRYIQLEHTNRCNARCIMCNHVYTGNRGASDLDRAILEKLEPILPYAETIMLNGDGEPFLYQKIRDSLELFMKYSVKAGANTNLTAIPEDIWDFLGEGFAFLNISCDGSSRELYESIRRELSFDVFLKNLDRLNRTAPGLKKNLDCVVMRQNLGDMKNLVVFAVEHHFSSIRFHLLGVNPVIGNEMDAPERYPDALRRNILEARETAERCHISIQLPAISAERKISESSVAARGGLASADGAYSEALQRKLNEAAERRTEKLLKAPYTLNDDYLNIPVTEEDLSHSGFPCCSLCRWALERCYIDLNGRMTTCCYNMKKYFGNLRQSSFEEIWNGTNYRKFRQNMLQGRLPDWCRACQWIRNPVF